MNSTLFWMLVVIALVVFIVATTPVEPRSVTACYHIASHQINATASESDTVCWKP